MTPQLCGSLMKRARHVLRAGLLKTRDITLLDCMMWSCRAPGMRQTAASLRRLSKLTRMCKDSVIAGLARLGAAGLLRKIKRRVRVAWGLGMASRQATNVYEFLPPATESAAPPVYREQVGVSRTTVVPVARKTLLDRALDRLRVGQKAVAPGLV